VKPSPSDWAIAARILPGGPWNYRATQLLRGAGIRDTELDEMLADSAIRIAGSWHRFDPSRGLAEWTFARHFVRAERSKRKRSKGGIVGPQHNNIAKLWPESKAAWQGLSAVSLEARLRERAGSTRTVAEIIPAPVPYDEAKAAAAVREVLATVADRSDPARRRWVLTAAAVLDKTLTEIADERGCARQGIGNARDRGIAYLREALTPAERFTLSLARSPE
jgi:DNA-directed RNA polymerase specialized sigma subunit